MEIILAAIGALVLVTVLDAQREAKPVTESERTRVCRAPRRTVARRSPRRPLPRLRPTPAFTLLRQRPSGPLWWWE